MCLTLTISYSWLLQLSTRVATVLICSAQHAAPMAQPKPLFIPWLKQQIDSGRYPGVQWVNQERTKFSIPWKHALRQDSNSDDILIFKVNCFGSLSVGTHIFLFVFLHVFPRHFRNSRFPGLCVISVWSWPLYNSWVYHK